MRNELSQMYLTANAKYFKSSKIPMIEFALGSLEDDKYVKIQAIKLIDPMKITIISVLVGCFGIDRFMIRDIGLGIAILLTLGGCGFWAVIDWFLIGGKAKQKNLEKIYRAFL